MAGTDQASFASLATTSYETALCIIPPQDSCHDIDALRSLYDKGYGKWPPHINLIYPFVAPESLPRAKELIQSAFRSAHQAQELPQLQVDLDACGCFRQRTGETIHLRESKPLGDGSLSSLRSVALQALGRPEDSCSFHLTLGQSEDKIQFSRDLLLSKAELVPHIPFSIPQLVILVKERMPGKIKTASRMRIYGFVDLTKETSGQENQTNEFWIRDSIEEESEIEVEDDEDETESHAMGISRFSRRVQPGLTYQFDTQDCLWVATDSEMIDSAPSPTLKISSYNVLVESEFPPARDRDALILRAIIERPAEADILILQEVSDGLLSHLLADDNIRTLYRFSSHGPPDQPDIGPLPSLRNVVILSRWYFSWKLVPFHRRHKGAVVAIFDSIKAPGSESPLVVAGVHLSCGLTDRSVAAKKVQVQNVRDYLSHNHATSPWIVAGDMNITTSSFTIETALRNKSISQQTARTLSSIQTMITEAGLHDAWSVARLEAADASAIGSALSILDDLFEGEDGATFNPRENVLAAATSGTSLNRPQRYDRILYKPGGSLHVTRFNLFGLPQEMTGTQSVPSDHWGIRASFKVLDDATKIPESGNILGKHPLHVQHASSTLADTTLLGSALATHGMFPTKEETIARQEAFALIKRIVLATPDEDAANSGIPLVMVTVGSYAMGTWTSSSDIDCLCIGSITSKTFFNLARQRIHKAEALGVRLLRKVEAATGTMFELSVNDISVDLQYCAAARIVERWSELPQLDSNDPVYNLAMLPLRKLKPFRDISYIQRTLPSFPTFRLAYRVIKLWAIQRGIYSSKFGYIGGIHITLMLSIICKRMAHHAGSANITDVVATFFHHYANFDWKNEVVSDPFFYSKGVRYHRSAREPMVILGLHAPNTNVAHTCSVPSLNTLVKELKLADRCLSSEGMTWTEFFGQADNTKLDDELGMGARDFLKSYESYVKIDIQYWGRTLSKGKSLVGWVESRSLLAVVDIHRVLPALDVRIWPARFTNAKPDELEMDYHGCYLIGLAKNEDAEAPITKDDFQAAREALQKAIERFQDQLQSDEKNYDPGSCWVGVQLAKPNEVKSLRLDDRDWGDYAIDSEDDPDDEVEPEEADELDYQLQAPIKLPLRNTTPSTTPISSNKLRPASDVLNRLRWDPSLDPSEYVVGYEDRFLGAKETTLEKWKTEQTDEEFIPQHRILYFKRRTDGTVVWERRTRIDLVFGSGAGAG